MQTGPWIHALLVAGCGGCSALATQEEPQAPSPEVVTHGKQLNFGVGVRSFADADFGELDNPAALTLDYCEPIGFGALRLEGGLHFATDDGRGSAGGTEVRLDLEVFEASAGFSFSHRLGRVRPYVGLGAALVFLELDGINSVTDQVFDGDEAVIGGYAKAGILLHTTATAHIGLEIRHFEGGDFTLDGTEIDPDSDQVILILGTSFE